MDKDVTAKAIVFNELRLEGKLCDVVINIEGIEFTAHKIILCGCSEYFQALFTGVCSDSKKRDYNIPGLSPDMMRLLIDYAYMQAVPVTGENVQELLAAADQFSVLGLLRVCCQFLEDQLCPENCIGIWRVADIYSCSDLKRRAHLYILHHFQETVRVSEEFLELSPDQLGDIIERDDLNVEQEGIVFQAVLRWIAHKEQNRKPFICALLPKVRVALMTTEYFIDNVKNNALVKETDVMRAMSNLQINGSSNSDFHSPLTRPRLRHSILLAIGGFNANSDTNGIEAYDGRAKRWVNVTKDDESPRAIHGAAYLNGFVYCVGGSHNGERLKSVRKFDPVTHTWDQAAPMHQCRNGVSVAVADGCIYAMGGHDGTVTLKTAECYKPETDQWTLIPSMQEQRSDASATSLQGKVYICGGFNGEEYLFSGECYNPESNQWSMIAPLWNRRCGLGVIAYGERVYAVGGCDGHNVLNCADVYNPATNCWNEVPDIFKARCNFGIEVVDDLLFVLGGYTGFNATCSVECYDKKTNLWSHATDMGMSRVSLSCCVVQGLPNVTECTVSSVSLPESREELPSTSNSVPSS